MFENLGGLTGFATFTTALGGLITWLVARRDKQKDPVLKETAQMALAEKSVGIAQQQIDSMRLDLERLRADRDADQERIVMLEGRLAITDRDLNITRRGVEDLRVLFFAATNHIERVLRWVRDGNPPPPPLLPELLKDHIDPSLQEWN